MGLLNDEVNRIKSSIDQSYVEAEALLSDAQESIPQQDKTIHNLSNTIKKIPPDKSKSCNATNDDMAAGKTAYVNRKKVMGGATDFSATYNVFNAKFVRNGATCEVRYTNNGTKLLRNQIPCTVPVKDQDIADALATQTGDQSISTEDAPQNATIETPAPQRPSFIAADAFIDDYSQGTQGATPTPPPIVPNGQSPLLPSWGNLTKAQKEFIQDAYDDVQTMDDYNELLNSPADVAQLYQDLKCHSLI
jgi:hypothetical protein